MSEDEKMSEADLDKRMDSLRSKLNRPENQPKVLHTGDSAEEQANRSGVAQAFKLSSEFIAGIVVGGGIGYGIDWFFGTSPWGFIIFFLLGFCAAILNVLRAADMVAESEMRLKPAQDMNKSADNRDADDTSQK